MKQILVYYQVMQWVVWQPSSYSLHDCIVNFHVKSTTSLSALYNRNAVFGINSFCCALNYSVCLQCEPVTCDRKHSMWHHLQLPYAKKWWWGWHSVENSIHNLREIYCIHFWSDPEHCHYAVSSKAQIKKKIILKGKACKFICDVDM